MIGRLALAQLGASAGDGQVVNDCRAVVMDVPLYPRVDGILGLSFLMHFQVRTPLCNLLFALLLCHFAAVKKPARSSKGAGEWQVLMDFNQLAAVFLPTSMVCIA